MRRYFTVLSVLAAVFAMGCGAAKPKGENLLDDIYAYNNGVRWHQYPKAAARVHPKERAEFIAELSSLESEVKIAEWELIHLEYPSKNAVHAHLRYTWHRNSKGIVHETNTMQKWRRHGKKWLIVGEQRVRGEPMPGVDEPEEDEEASQALRKAREGVRLVLRDTHILFR